MDDGQPLIVEDAITPISAHGADPAPSRYVRRREHNNFVGASPQPGVAPLIQQMAALDSNAGIRPGPASRRPHGSMAVNAPTIRPPPVKRRSVPSVPGASPTSSPRGFRPTSAPGERQQLPGPAARPSSAVSYGARDFRPSSAAGDRNPKPPQTARPALTPGAAANYVGWWMPDDELLMRTPVPSRRPAAEDLQQELTMTAGVLRSAQSRLAEEREHRLRARAGEELAMVDLRRLNEEARQLKEERRAQDRKHVKALTEQRKALEDQLQRVEGEQEAAIAALKREREQTADLLREAHADHTRELEEQLLAAQEEREELLRESERLRKQQAEDISQSAHLEAQTTLEREKEKRVEHLQGIGVRRLLKQGLARGWSAWHSLYEAHQRRTRLLQQVGNRLLRPKLTAAYFTWRHDWEAVQISHAAMTHEQKLAHEVAERRAAEAEAERLRSELSIAREALAKEMNQDDVQKNLMLELEQEKEKRIEHLKQVGLRRLLKQGLARGWTAWHVAHTEQVRKRQVMAKVGSRLGRPKVVACYLHWYRDWKATSRAQSKMSREERMAAEAAERTAIEEGLRYQLKHVTGELLELRETVEAERAQEADTKHRIEVQLEAEKEKRVQHLQHVGMRRLMQQGLARGWTAWHELYAKRQRQRQLLKQAGNRLKRPKLSASYAHWRRGWEIEAAASAEMTYEQRLATEIADADALRAEVRHLKKALEKSQSDIFAGRGKEAEMKRLMEEQLEVEKEKRVAHLQKVGVRRLLQQGLARGWTAWHDMHTESTRRRNMLKQAGARLTRPRLVSSYTHWRRDWEIETASQALSTQEHLLAREAAQRQTAERNLLRQLDDAKKHAAEVQQRLDDGQYSEAAMKLEMEAELEAEREKRVEHLQQIGVRRLLQQGLARGWSGWHDQYRERLRKRNLLKQAGARLTRPRLVMSYTSWRRDWEITKLAQKAMTNGQRLATEAAERGKLQEELQIKLAMVTSELAEAREAMLTGRGQEAELKRRMEAELEAEKEKRVGHLQQMGVRRLMQQGLARGWSAWHGQYTEHVYKRNMLKQAGARLTRPKLIACYTHWRRDWESAERANTLMTQEERMAFEAAERRSSEEALQAQVHQLIKELADAREAMLEGRGQEAELQRQMEAQLEAEKEKRVAHLQQMGVRRLLQQGLARGWSAWHDKYTEHVYKRNMLKQAGARLTRPKLIACYTHWRRDWEMEMAANATLTSEQKLAASEESNRSLKADVERIRKELAEAREAMLEGRGQEAELQRQMEAEKEKRVEHLQQMGVRRLLQQGLARGWSAWHDKYTEHVYKRNMLRQAGARLTRPKLIASYTQWRRDWEMETAVSATLTREQELTSEREISRKLQSDVEQMRKELAEAREAMLEGRGQEAELQRQMEAQLEAEREKRVAHLQQMGVRRLLQQGLARGWSAWHDKYTEQVYKRNMLRQAGARLTRPKLIAFYTHWRRDWEMEMAANATMTSEQKLSAQRVEQERLEAVNRQLMLELEHSRELALSGRAMESELQRRMEAQLEAEREKRVEHLQTLGLRRLLNQGLARGWTAWQGMHLEQRRKRNMLKQAGARLTRPKLIACYANWRRDWEIEVQANAFTTNEQRSAAKLEQRDASFAELQRSYETLRVELAEAREAMLAGRGQEAELKRRMEAELEAEKEKRVGHLQQMGVRRLMQQGLARGWSAWHGQYTEHVYKRNMLKQAGARLTRPKLIACYTHWRRDWESAERANTLMTQEERMAFEAAERRSSEEALQAQVHQLIKELADAREAMLEGRGQEAELQRQMEAQLEAEKEKRVAHLQQMGVRRLLQQGLARGWSAWHDKYTEHVYKRNMLKQAGARLTRPKLIACYTHWRRDWEMEMAANATMTSEQKLAASEESNRSLKADVERIRKELAEAREAMLEGRGQEAELQRQMEAEKEKRVEHLQQMGVRRLLQQGLARGWSAWHDQYTEHVYKRNMLRQAGARLTRPKLIASYTHWRRDWEMELAASATLTQEQKLTASDERNRQLLTELAHTRKELEAVRASALAGKGQEAELQRQMDAQLEAEKEKRVAHLQQMGVRRLLQQGLARGWSAWYAQYSEQVYKRRLLQQAGARLAKPKVAAAYNLWMRDWDAAFAAKAAEAAKLAAMTSEQRIAVEMVRREEAETQLLRVQKELAEARQNGFGQEAELKRRMEAELEAEREKRVAHLQQMGVRRLLQQGLARGWSAWHDKYKEHVYKRNMLRQAGARLTRPKLIASYTHWRRDWEMEIAANATMTSEQKLAVERENSRKLQSDVEQMRKELAEAREAMLEGRGQEAELQRQMEAQLEAEREKRVAHLQQMGVRRLLQQGLARGWSAWHDKYTEHVYKRNMLRQAGARLTRPKLIASYTHWRRDWEMEMAANATMTSEQKLAVERESNRVLMADVVKMRKELAEAREAMLEGRGQEAELQRQMEAQLEAEKEKRVAHLQQMGVRRLLQQGLARGWSAWHDKYTEHVYKRNMLRQAGARLTRPKLIASYTHWRRDWEMEIAANATLTSEQKLAIERENSRKLQSDVERMCKELAEAREAMLEGRGQEAELQRQMEAQLEAEKEKRVAHLQQMGVRRLLQQGLARGWSAWHDKYTEHVYKRNMLRQAGARLTRPKLIASYTHWRRDWDLELTASATMTQEQKLTAAVANSNQLEQALSQARAQLEQARIDMLAGRGQEAEMKRLLEEELEREREKRVAHLQQIGVRRLLQQGLARGWTSWLYLYNERERRRRLLQQAGHRMAKPKLSAAYWHWRRDWDLVDVESQAKQKALATMDHKNRLKFEIAARELAEKTMDSLKGELVEAREAMLAGRGQEAELQRLMDEKLQAEKEKRIAHLQGIGVRRLLKQGLARGWTSWMSYHFERTRKRRLLSAAAGRLVRPRLVACYTQWRRDWEVELAHHAKISSSSRTAAQHGAVQAELQRELKKALESAEQSRRELAEAREAMLAGQGQEAEMKRLMEKELEEEREKRVANIQQIFMRRMLQQDLARGWTAWYDKYAAKIHNARVMKQGFSRLTRPKLAKSFIHWYRDWDAALVEKSRLLMMSQSQRDLEETKQRLAAQEEMQNERIRQETAKREALETELRRHKESHEEEIALQHVALVEARKAATDAVARAAAEKATADSARSATEEVAAAERRRQTAIEKAAETERQLEDSKDELHKLRSTTTEEIALQHVALIEARKAATDALSRVAVEKASIDAVRSSADKMSAEVGRALSAEKAAVAEATRIQDVLLQYQSDSEEKLNRLLEEHRGHLTNEIMRITDDYERRLAELRIQVARYAAAESSPAKVRPKVTFQLKHDPNKSIAEQLRVQVRDYGLRISELFNILDTDVDGYVSREDWKVGIKKIGPDLSDEEIDDTFLLVDTNSSNFIDLGELEKFVKEGLARRKLPTPEKSAGGSSKWASLQKAKKVDSAKGQGDGKNVDKKQLNLLTALATSMGVKPERQWFTEASSANIVGDGGQDFQDMMRERAGAFGHADLDQDGELDFDEFCAMVKYRETTKYTEKQLREKFADLDADGSGKVDLPEFISYSLRDSLKRSKGRAIDLFRIWDEDDSGYIDKNEFGKAIIALGFVAGRDDIAKVFDDLDEDGSGQIEYKELQTILRKPTGAQSRKPVPPSTAKPAQSAPRSAKK